MRVGEDQPKLARMLIDFEGDNAPTPSGQPGPTIWLTRAGANVDILIGALQIGFPAPAPALLDLAEIWTLNPLPGQLVLVPQAWTGTFLPWGIPFGPLPGPSGTFTVQVACLLGTPLQSPFCLDSSSNQIPMSWFASPALFFQY